MSGPLIAFNTTCLGCQDDGLAPSLLEYTLAAALFRVAYYNTPKCLCNGQAGGNKCQNDCQCETCKKAKISHSCSPDCSDCYNSINNSNLVSLFIAFSFLIALAIYFLKHVNYAPSLKAAFKRS